MRLPVHQGGRQKKIGPTTYQSWEPTKDINNVDASIITDAERKMQVESERIDAFDALMARDWLNALVDSMEQRRALDRLNSQIETVPTMDYIQIYSGILVLADVLGEELQEYNGRKDEYREYFFFFRGVRVVQLSRERIGKYARTD